MARSRNEPANRTPSAKRVRALAQIVAAHERCDRTVALARDPVQFPRGYTARHDREIAAMLSALLAFGNVEAIRGKLRRLFALLAPSPAAAAIEWPAARVEATLAGFVHRTFRGEDVARLVVAAGELIRRDGGLYVALERAFVREGTLRDALVAYTDVLRAIAWPHGMTRSSRHLLPDPRGASACKRLALLTRWIARPDDGVDLGLAAIPTSALVIPLDVHVHRVARALGLTRRASASWLAAEEVTAALRALDRDDPVRFDFAVCHVEIEAFRARRRHHGATG